MSVRDMLLLLRVILWTTATTVLNVVEDFSANILRN